MMGSSNISIQVKNGEFAMDFIGDILVGDFQSICVLLFSNSKYFAEIYIDLLLFTFYRTFVIGYVIFLFNCANCSYGNSFLNSLQLFFYHFIYYFISISSYLVKKYIKKHKHKHNLDILICQYENNSQMLRINLKTDYFYKIQVHSIIESSLFFLFSNYIIFKQTSMEGQYISQEYKQSIGLYVIGFVCNIKILTISNQNYKEGVVNFAVFVVFSAIYLPLEVVYTSELLVFEEFATHLFTPGVFLSILSIFVVVFVVNIVLECNIYVPQFFTQGIVRLQ